MKRLLIAAFAVAAAATASAMVCTKSECGEDAAGIAHKVTISLKTTALKSKTGKIDQCGDGGECTYWREQKTRKIQGLIWEALSDCSGCTMMGENYAFWWDKGSAIALDDFAAGVGIIGKGTNSKKIEAYGNMVGGDFGELAWAGFGSLQGRDAKTVNCEETDCAMWVKSISGGIAGKLVAPEFEGKCGDTCDAIVYDGCSDDTQLSMTAAYGTIKISYDKSTSKKVALAEDGAPVSAFYKLPASAAAEIEDVVGTISIEE